MESRVRVYGTEWCRLTYSLREYLMRSRIEYEYFDIDRNARADKFVRRMNAGVRLYPVVVIANEAVTNPMLAQVRAMLDHDGR
jgi:thioredoxin reductase (NADPH)